MSLSSGFFNSLNGDRKYDATQMGQLFDGIITDGIYETIGDRFAVSARSGMTISVGTGRAWFNHSWILNDSPIVLTCEVAPQVLKRIDTVVIDVDYDKTVRASNILIISGTPSSNPTPAVLIHTDTHNQYPLADIYIDSNMTEITPASITSRIGSSECPFVTGILEHGDIDDLISKWTYELDSRIEELDEMIAQTASKSLIDNSVTTPKIADKSVTRAKLGEDVQDAIDEAKINPNLLDNGWFTVNQRGQSSYIAAPGKNLYCVDRWKVIGNMSVNENGVSLSPGSIVTNYSELERFEWGKEYTASVKDSVGNITSISFTLPDTVPSEKTVFAEVTSDNFTLTVAYSKTVNIVNCYVTNISNANIEIRAVKLEYGTVSTLANDHAPDYISELEKCQYYFYAIGDPSSIVSGGEGYIYEGNRAFFTILKSMRTAPTATYTGTWELIYSGTSRANVSEINVSRHSINSFRFEAKLASSVMTKGYSCMLQNSSNKSYIAFSADL